MSQQERSILIGISAIVLAAAGFFFGYQAVTGSDSIEAGADQFIKTPATTLPARGTEDVDERSQRPPPGEAQLAPLSPLADADEAADPATADPGQAKAATPTTEPPVTGSVAETVPESVPEIAPKPVEEVPGPVPETVPETVPLPPPPDPNVVSPVERQIAQLTNELRANPAGPHARTKPMPECANDPFYNITVDPGTGHPVAAPALVFSDPLSLQMARPWSAEMDRTASLSHRPAESAQSTYSLLGISYAAAGENISWFSGYEQTEAAAIHFRGWVESDSGHYCALISSTYTHVGVGHFVGAERTWATQNFYQAN